MKNFNASASIFGWHFQINVAIFFMLNRSLKKLLLQREKFNVFSSIKHEVVSKVVSWT